MNLLERKYVLIEIIPTKVSNGLLAQVSALKIDGIKLIDRFDYRINRNLIDSFDILKMTNYDNDKFKYVNNNIELYDALKDFIKDYPLIFINNIYTNNYLDCLKNEKIDFFKLLGMEITDDVFDNLIEKYNLESSNYIVDLMYEALIKEL